MCTVTFIPTASGAYLTSSRDEHRDRALALPPKQYNRKGHRIIYPSDPDSSGSWIALKENGDAGVLLNGAFIKHRHRSDYRRSRGMIFLDILETDDPYIHFTVIDLCYIEPFTLILFSGKRLWECRWDGFRKHLLLLDASKPYIWSSATLYSPEAVHQRKRWFLEWFSSASPVLTEKVMGFHRYAGKGDLINGLMMNRENRVYTVSITSLCIKPGKAKMDYEDLQTGVATSLVFSFLPLRKSARFLLRFQLAVRKIAIRIKHWEYWPAHFVYGPLYVYWCWLSLRARSFFFFSAANPGIRYSGFVQERKSDIYKLIPPQYYPRTKLCCSSTPPSNIMQWLKDKRLTFPLIAKPDMGERGIQVKLLQSEEELDLYKNQTKVDFLLQEFINYELEVGIFYYRIPGEENGHISGVVGKEFLKVSGDGVSDIEALLKREDRFLLQLSALRHTYGDFLNTVPEVNEQCLLVPYGNHSRGSKFINMEHKITEQLITVIDQVCSQIPGFYYGRLDIKFKSWEDLALGKNFSIIELNGAGSEPTHIYDPSNSIWYAWKEICRHWRLLYLISSLNAKKEKRPLMNTTEGIKMIRDHHQYLKQLSQI